MDSLRRDDDQWVGVNCLSMVRTIQEPGLKRPKYVMTRNMNIDMRMEACDGK